MRRYERYGIRAKTASAISPPHIPKKNCVLATLENASWSRANNPREAEMNMKNPTVTKTKVTIKNGRSMCLRMLGIRNVYSAPTSANKTPKKAAIIEKTQYRMVTLYDGHPIASK